MNDYDPVIPLDDDPDGLPCPKCKGAGMYGGTEWPRHRCPQCSGSGYDRDPEPEILTRRERTKRDFEALVRMESRIYRDRLRQEGKL